MAELLTVPDAKNGPKDGWLVYQAGLMEWYARLGDADLCSVNTRKPRRFRSVSEALSRLREEVGVLDFRVKALSEARIAPARDFGRKAEPA